ncbi:hypothetical protein AB0E69_01160 [Kribbella sp. NPDC026611]
MTRRPDPKTAWRRNAMCLSACVRSGHEDNFYYHQLGIELSLTSGGPPG